MDVIGDAPTEPAPGRGRHRLSRWGRPAAIVAVLGLLGYVLTHRYPAPAATSHPQPSPSATPERQWLTGRPGFGPPGIRVVLNGRNPRIVDLHTGGQQAPASLPRQASETAAYLVPFRGGLIAYVSGSDSNDLYSSYLLRPGRPTRLVVTRGVAIPSWDGGSLIVLPFARQAGRVVVTGQALDGRRLWQWSILDLITPVRDTRHGLLLQGADLPDGDPSLLRLVRRDSGRLLRRLGGAPVAIGDDYVAHVRPGCGRRCALRLTRLDTGAVRSFPLPAEPATYFGQFSPGNRRLALTFPAGASPGDVPRRPGTAAVLDLGTGTVSPVPGFSTPGGDRPLYAWSADGRWLIVAVREKDAMRMGVWQPDRPRDPVRVLPPVPYSGERGIGLTALP